MSTHATVIVLPMGQAMIENVSRIQISARLIKLYDLHGVHSYTYKRKNSDDVSDLPATTIIAHVLGFGGRVFNYH
jgi:hypothetical protein